MTVFGKLKLCLAACALLALPLSARAGSPVVLFDEGHNQQFLVGQEGELDLSGLARLFREERVEVRASTGPLTAEALGGAAGLVISGPFAPFTPAEIEAVAGFLDRGGRLAVMLHIGMPVGPLLGSLGVEVSPGPVHEMADIIDGTDLNFTLSRFAQHPLTAGLDKFRVYGCWALKPTRQGVLALASTGKYAWLDWNNDRRYSAGDPVGSLVVATTVKVGRGEAVIFGDDALFQNRFLKDENRELGRRLGRWLSGVLAPPAGRPRVTDL
jgi:hypothetical protein